MRLVPILIRGDKTTSTVDVSKEVTLIAPANTTTVECWKILYEKCTIGIQNDRKISRFTNQGAITVDLVKVWHPIVFKNVWVGHIDTETQSQYLKENLEYICTKWGKVYGACTLAWYDLDTSTFVSQMRMYKGSAFQNQVVAPPKAVEFEFDQLMNAVIPQVVFEEVVTIT